MLSSRNIIIGVAVVIVLAIGVVAYMQFKGGSANPGSAALNEQESNAPAPQSVGGGLAAVAIDSSDIPSDPAITIGTPSGPVKVLNFYKSAIGRDAETFVLANETGYQISYDSDSSAFAISILQLGGSAQKDAEAKFLQMLGVSETEACKLNASESAAGKTYPLSFCGGGMRI